MNTPLTPEEIAALADEANAETPPREFYREDLGFFFGKWAENTKIMSGPIPALTSEDLFRHFSEFLTRNGYEIPKIRPQDFGRQLKSLGLFKGRVGVAGRDSRPYMVDLNSATYFRAWLKEHPRPPVNEGVYDVELNRKYRNKKGTPT